MTPAPRVGTAPRLVTNSRKFAFRYHSCGRSLAGKCIMINAGKCIMINYVLAASDLVPFGRLGKRHAHHLKSPKVGLRRVAS